MAVALTATRAPYRARTPVPGNGTQLVIFTCAQEVQEYGNVMLVLAASGVRTSSVATAEPVPLP